MSVRGDERLAEQNADERLLSGSGIRHLIEGFVARIRGGDLGALPVVLGIIVIWTVFQALNPAFLSSENLVNLTMQCAAIGTIALGVVVVLLVGEIDLSVGSVSGLSAAVLAVTFVQLQWNLVLSLVAALGIGCLVGLLYGFLFTRFGLPSFVITLAGLLGFLGLQLWVLGRTGSIAIPFDSWIVMFAQQLYLPPWAAYALAVVAVGVYAWSRVRHAQRRTAANLVSQGYAAIAARSCVLLAFLVAAIWYLSLGSRRRRDVPLLPRARRGHELLPHAHALGPFRVRGRRLRRSGPTCRHPRRPDLPVGVRAVLDARRRGRHPRRGTTRLGQPEFGHRRRQSERDRRRRHRRDEPVRAGAARRSRPLVGIVVIQSISSGLSLLNLDSSVQFMVTGVVLVLAVIVDSLSRRTRAATGRA